MTYRGPFRLVDAWAAVAASSRRWYLGVSSPAAVVPIGGVAEAGRRGGRHRRRSHVEASSGLRPKRAGIRDGDLGRHAGLGCRAAVEAVEGEIARELGGRSFQPGWTGRSPVRARRSLKERPRQYDPRRVAGVRTRGRSVARFRSTPSPGATGAGAAITGLSSACSPAAHRQRGRRPGCSAACARTPRPGVEILDTIAAVYRAAVELTRERFDMRLLRADEGGLAPPFETSEQMFAAAVESVERAGLRPGNDVALAVDVAASQPGRRRLSPRRGARRLVERSARWITEFDRQPGRPARRGRLGAEVGQLLRLGWKA